MGLPFTGTFEKWTIKTVRKRVKIVFKDFRIPCRKGMTLSDLQLQIHLQRTEIEFKS
jgi:hypothetical protein